MKDFFAMGGYAFYVWTSYAVAGVVLIANILIPIRLRLRLLADIARKMRRARREP